MADRSASPAAIVAVLHAMKRSGVDHAGILYTRSEATTLLPGESPEEAYVIPTDFGMQRVELATCPATVLNEWPAALQRNPTVCLGSLAAGAGATGQAEGSDVKLDMGGMLGAQGSAAVEGAGPEENLFPCKDTYRTLLPPKEACAAGLVAWCATDGAQVACCTKNMVARTRDGACQCPPGGVPADAPPSKCRHVTAEPNAVAATQNADGGYDRADGGPELGRLSPSRIREVVRAASGKMRRCYETALKRVPNESGRLTVRFEIGPDGRVFFAHIQDTTLSDPAAQACMLEEFRALRFPPPVGGVVTVNYPLVFSPGD